MNKLRTRPHRPKATHGFTLVELAIVLVIIGLLVGGVLVGRDLIHSAELNSILNQQDQIFVAVRTFQTTYGSLPGDLSKQNVLGGATIVGNGDGQIAELPLEQFAVWQQLALAGYIPGTYSGTKTGGGCTSNICVGTDVPAAKNLGVGDGSCSNQVTGWALCWTNFGGYGKGSANRLTLASPGWSTGPCTMGCSAQITPADAQRVDAKADDGSAGYGWITAEDGSAFWGQCVSSGFGWSTEPSNYLVSNTGRICRMWFKL